MEYHSVMKKESATEKYCNMDGSQKHYIKWKIKTFKKILIVWFYLYKMSRKRKSILAENKLEVAWGKGWKQGLIPNGYEVVFWGNGNVLKLGFGAGYTSL